MLKVEKKMIEIETVTQARCDKCKGEIGQVEFFGGKKNKEVDDFSNVDGLHLEYVPGYGTEYDRCKIKITLCTLCIVELAKSLGSVIERS